MHTFFGIDIAKRIENNCMKTIFLSLFIAISTLIHASQSQNQDPKAKAILDEVSKTTKAYKTIVAEYELVVLNKDKKQTDKQKGKIQVKGSKFKLEITGNTIICDGKTVWTHNKDANEVSIKNFEANNEDGIDPTKIFTLYETGYRYQFVKDEKLGANLCSQIDLYPTVKPEKKKYHTVKLYVDKKSKQIKKLIMMMKDGGTQSYEVKTMKPNTNIPDASFVFDLKPFKADQIVDER